MTESDEHELQEIERERRDLHDEMDSLVVRLRRLDMRAAELNRRSTERQSRTTRGSGRQATPGRPINHSDVRVGMRVRCMRRDQYKGRMGTVLGLHTDKPGCEFWDIRLDRLDLEETGPVIYKKATSLFVVD